MLFRSLIPATVLALKAGQHITDQKVEMMSCGFVSGRVVDDTGDPVPGSALQLRAAPPDTDFVNPFAIPLPNYTDDRGAFRIVVSPGNYYLQAMPLNYVPGQFGSAMQAKFSLDVFTMEGDGPGGDI